MLEEIRKRANDRSIEYVSPQQYADDTLTLLSLILTSKELDTIGYWYEAVSDVDKEALKEEDFVLYKKVMELKKKVGEDA